MMMTQFFSLKAYLKNIDAVLWILYAFETLFGIKINYLKTALIPINLGHAKAQTLAAMIGCNFNFFPISYLGIPLHDKKLRAKN
jgi:uncharacterized protein YqgC (DUF456 family)